MNIGGLVKNSFVDYPQQIAAVIFTNGCNMNCWYCHNQDLITGTRARIPEDFVLSYLKERKNKIDGVVITGGEPTLQIDLLPFIKKIKDMGYLVKLDTNGSNPNILEELISLKLIDYIAMDIKAPKNKLNSI